MRVPVVKLAPWLRSFFYSTIAGSRKSKVWVANDRFRGQKKKLRHGTNRWPVRPRRWLLQDPEPRRASRPACDDSWTDRQGIIPRFPFSILAQHVACCMLHVTCRHHRQAAQAPHQRFTTGSPRALSAGPLINLPLAAFVLPNSSDISPSLVPHCPVLFCLPRLSLPPGTTVPPQSTPQNGRLLPQLATVPLARLQFLTRANTHDGTRLIISLQ